MNVIAFGDADSTTAVMSNLKLSVTPPSTSDRGWGRLDIQSSNATPMLWNLAGTDDGNVDAVVSGLDAGMAGFTALMMQRM